MAKTKFTETDLDFVVLYCIHMFTLIKTLLKRIKFNQIFQIMLQRKQIYKCINFCKYVKTLDLAINNMSPAFTYAKLKNIYIPSS